MKSCDNWEQYNAPLKPNSETSSKDVNNNQCEIYYPKVTSSKITSQLHLRMELNPVM